MADLQLRQLSAHNKEPLYAQIIHILEQQIRAGRLSPGDKLPTQQQLADHFEVSLAPVKQALRELEERGIVSTRQGRGTYVLDITPLSEEIIEANRIPCFTREMRESGREPSSIVLAIEEIDAQQQPQAAEQLKAQASDKLVHIERVREADGRPLCLQSGYFLTSQLPGIVERGLGSKEALSEVLRAEYEIVIVASHQTITATAAGQRDARHLKVKVGAPLLLVERTSYLGTREPVEFVIDHRVPEFNFVVWLRRQ